MGLGTGQDGAEGYGGQHTHTQREGVTDRARAGKGPRSAQGEKKTQFRPPHARRTSLRTASQKKGSERRAENYKHHQRHQRHSQILAVWSTLPVATTGLLRLKAIDVTKCAWASYVLRLGAQRTARPGARGQPAPGQAAAGPPSSPTDDAGVPAAGLELPHAHRLVVGCAQQELATRVEHDAAHPVVMPSLPAHRSAWAGAAVDCVSHRASTTALPCALFLSLSLSLSLSPCRCPRTKV